MKRISDEMLANDLLNVSKKIKKKITSSEYIELGKYSLPTIKERFGTWGNFVKKIGLEQTCYIKNVDTPELFSKM